MQVLIIFVTDQRRHFSYYIHLMNEIPIFPLSLKISFPLFMIFPYIWRSVLFLLSSICYCKNFELKFHARIFSESNFCMKLAKSTQQKHFIFVPFKNNAYFFKYETLFCIEFYKRTIYLLELTENIYFIWQSLL